MNQTRLSKQLRVTFRTTTQAVHASWERELLASPTTWNAISQFPRRWRIPFDRPTRRGSFLFVSWSSYPSSALFLTLILPWKVIKAQSNNKVAHRFSICSDSCPWKSEYGQYSAIFSFIVPSHLVSSPFLSRSLFVVIQIWGHLEPGSVSITVRALHICIARKIIPGTFFPRWFASNCAYRRHNWRSQQLVAFENINLSRRFEPMTSSLCSSFRCKSPGRSATVLVLFFGIEYYIVPVGLCGCAKRGPGVVRK